jgi:hypothetical protein
MEPGDRTVERRGLESAVVNQSHLRGLGLVPIGLMFVLWALALWEVGPLRHLWVFPMAVLLLTVGPVLWINRYYEERYGRFTPSARRRVRAAVALAVGFAVGLPLLVGMGLLLRSEEAWSLDLPVNPIAATWAIAMLAVSASTVGVLKHRVIICGSLLVAGLLPVWNGVDPTATGVLMVGVANIAMGIFDHRRLVRTLGSPADRGLEARDAGA